MLRVMVAALAILAVCVPFVIATLAGLPALAAALVGLIVLYALAIPWIITCLIPTTIVREHRLVVDASRESVFATIANPRTMTRLAPAAGVVDQFSGEAGVVGCRWRTRLPTGVVFFAEVVEAAAPARFVLQSRSAPRWPRRPVLIEVERTLDVTPAGTEIRVRQVVHTVLAGRLIAWLVRSQAEYLRDWLDDRVKAELEGASAAQP